MKTQKLLWTILFIFGAKMALGSIHPVYQQLKTYRTYYEITKVTKFAHRFDAWFNYIDYNHCALSFNSLEEIQKLNEESLKCAWGSIAIPPKTTKSIPEAMQPYARALAAKLKSIHPKLSNLKMEYAGQFRTVRMHELTPLMPVGDVWRRFTKRSRVQFSIDRAGKVSFYGMRMLGGTSLVCFKDEKKCSTLPTFLPYVLPQWLEGNSLMVGLSGPNAHYYKNEWARFSRTLVDTVNKIAAGTYRNPINQILAAQGNTLLPSKLKSFFSFEVDTYARTKDFQNQVSERVEFNFPTTLAYHRPMKGKATSRWTGLTYEVTVSLRHKILELTVTSNTGKKASARTYFTGSYLFGDSVVAIDKGFLSPEKNDERLELHLPGTGIFTVFDIYPDAEMRTTSTNILRPVEISLH